jgi:hypothetical protein
MKRTVQVGILEEAHRVSEWHFHRLLDKQIVLETSLQVQLAQKGIERVKTH